MISCFSGYGFGYGSVTVLVTVTNIHPSPLIAQLNGLIAFIHRGSVAVCHSCSLSVSEVLGGSSKLRVAGIVPLVRRRLSRLLKGLLVCASHRHAQYRLNPLADLSKSARAIRR